MGSLGLELTEDEVNLLAMKYCDLGNKFAMNYWDFCDTCDPKPVWMDQGVKDRTVNLKPDNTFAAHGRLRFILPKSDPWLCRLR